MQACGPGSSTPSQGRPLTAGLVFADPDWASYTLGVFICLSCSGIHRNIPHVSKVKSVRLDNLGGCAGGMAGPGAGWGEALPAARRPQASDPARGACPLPRQPQTQPSSSPRRPPACPVPREPTRPSCGQGVGVTWLQSRRR